MTEEVIQNVVEQTATQDPYADLAQQYGWTPEKGDKSPREFIEYAMQNLEPRGKELKEVKQTLAKVEQHIELLAQEKYERKLQELAQRKAEAIEAGNIEEVDKIYKESAALKPPVDEMAAVNAFKNKYANLQSDLSLEAYEIRSFLEKRDEDLGKKGLDAETHMRILETDMLKKFPTYFDMPAVKSPVEKDTNSSSDTKGTKKFGYADLNKEQKEVANFMKSRGIPVEKYIENLARSGAL